MLAERAHCAQVVLESRPWGRGAFFTSSIILALLPAGPKVKAFLVKQLSSRRSKSPRAYVYASLPLTPAVYRQIVPYEVPYASPELRLSSVLS